MEICRLSDTAPKGLWPKKSPSPLTEFGNLTYAGMMERDDGDMFVTKQTLYSITD